MAHTVYYLVILSPEIGDWLFLGGQYFNFKVFWLCFVFCLWMVLKCNLF